MNLGLYIYITNQQNPHCKDRLNHQTRLSWNVPVTSWRSEVSNVYDCKRYSSPFYKQIKFVWIHWTHAKLQNKAPIFYIFMWEYSISSSMYWIFFSLISIYCRVFLMYVYKLWVCLHLHRKCRCLQLLFSFLFLNFTAFLPISYQTLWVGFTILWVCMKQNRFGTLVPFLARFLLKIYEEQSMLGKCTGSSVMELKGKLGETKRRGSFGGKKWRCRNAGWVLLMCLWQSGLGSWFPGPYGKHIQGAEILTY